MRIEFEEGSLRSGPQGLEIGVVGFRGDPTAAEHNPSQLYIEVYEGKLRVHIWNGSSEDPQTIDIAPKRKE